MTFNPSMLVTARASRRMTQKNLAEASGTKQATISRAEAGVHVPTADHILAWSKALRYPVDFFDQSNEAPPLPRTFWRKQAKLGKTDQKEIEATIAIRCLNIEALARSVDLPEPNLTACTIGVHAATATEAARWLRAYWRVPSGPILNLTQLLEDNGILVVRIAGTGVGFNGVSIWDSRRTLPPLMFVWAGAPTDRDRWTLAHELGHMVMHHHLRVCEDEDTCEDEADEFASEFLLPKHEVRHHFPARTGLAELAQLKLFWRVSMMALLRRGKTVGRISPERYTQLAKQMSIKGYRRVEPNPLPREPATMLQEMVRVHIEDLEYTLEEFAAALTLDVEDVYANFEVGKCEHTAPSVPTASQDAENHPRLRLV